jgi:hypothetical protein
MVQDSGKPTEVLANPDRHNACILEKKSMTKCRLLLVPAEIRMAIYRLLFIGRKVTIHRSAQSEYGNPSAIMHTCRICYVESLPLFYELATITLKHDAFLYVLGRRIGPQNMARVRNIIIAGFNPHAGNVLAQDLPQTVKKLVIKWKGGTRFSTTGPPGCLKDAEIRRLLDGCRRSALDSCVKALWNKNANLEIYLEGVVGDDPLAEVSFIYTHLKLNTWQLCSNHLTIDRTKKHRRRPMF